MTADHFVKDDILPKLVDYYNSFAQGDDFRFSVDTFYGEYAKLRVLVDADFVQGFYDWKQITLDTDYGDEGGGALVTATFQRSLHSDEWTLVSITHCFEGATDLIWKVDY